MMKTISLLQPAKIVIGRGCEANCAADLLAAGARRVLVVTSPPLKEAALQFAARLGTDAAVEIWDQVVTERTIDCFEAARAAARA